ncbi:hypothetical protein MHH42_30960 [Bacillus sp. FSL L8-0099]|uniref:hypothetical protein n=1 Tax=unclassified Bacillus (in: firmicutes) TaxID=185979 RepID=UPI0030F66A18
MAKTKKQLVDEIKVLDECITSMSLQLAHASDMEIKKEARKATDSILDWNGVVKRVCSTKTGVNSVYKETLKRIQEDFRRVYMELLELKKKVHTYISHGIEFVEHAEHVGVSIVDNNPDWKMFLANVIVKFKKDIVFMVRKGNLVEEKIMRDNNLFIEKELKNYHQCFIEYKESEMLEHWQVLMG